MCPVRPECREGRGGELLPLRAGLFRAHSKYHRMGNSARENSRAERHRRDRVQRLPDDHVLPTVCTRTGDDGGSEYPQTDVHEPRVIAEISEKSAELCYLEPTHFDALALLRLFVFSNYLILFNSNSLPLSNPQPNHF